MARKKTLLDKISRYTMSVCYRRDVFSQLNDWLINNQDIWEIVRRLFFFKKKRDFIVM